MQEIKAEMQEIKAEMQEIIQNNEDTEQTLRTQL